MEIPQNLKTLYKHWQKHTSYKTSPHADNTQLNPQILSKIETFITKRMHVWKRKTQGQQPPYTTDPVLSNYRFCNIYRELDRQTIVIHQDLQKYNANFPLWLLNVAFHRFVCKPETITKVGHLSYDPHNNTEVYKNLCTLPKPKFGNAYVFPVSIIQHSPYKTREEFFCFYLPNVMQNVARTISSFNDLTINKALERVLPIFGYNFKFHWTEILIDTAYQYPQLLNLFSDFHVGPGALPTAKLLNSYKLPTEVVDQCVNVHFSKFPYLTFEGKPMSFSAENWEGIFCEFRKYSNLKQGGGRKRKYCACLV